MSSNVYGATLKSATVSKTKTYRWDLTHDGKSDSVKFVIAKDNYNMINKLQIHVNGKKAILFLICMFTGFKYNM